MDIHLRHTLATLAYRLGKVLRETPPEFRDFSGAPGLRTPGQILAHINDLLDWALALVEGRKYWHESGPLPWPDEIARFYAALEKLDRRIEEYGTGPVDVDRLFQSAIADAFTHTGQLALLRRMAGIPVRGEYYFFAEIVPGRVGPHQADPKREF